MRAHEVDMYRIVEPDEARSLAEQEQADTARRDELKRAVTEAIFDRLPLSELSADQEESEAEVIQALKLIGQLLDSFRDPGALDC